MHYMQAEPSPTIRTYVYTMHTIFIIHKCACARPVTQGRVIVSVSVQCLEHNI